MFLPRSVDARPRTGTAVQMIDGVKVYGRGSTAVRALDGVTLDVPAARFTAVMGPSGSGKSTLMHCLAGLDTLTGGRVLLGDVDLGRLSDNALTKLRRERVGFVFQSFNLVPTLTAGENITLPARLARSRPEGSWIGQVVDIVGLRDRLSHRPSELSGGQQQRWRWPVPWPTGRTSCSPTSPPATSTPAPGFRVSPLAALRAADVDSTSTSRMRVLAGAVLGAVGVALVMSGTGGSGSMPQAGFGALVVVVAFVAAGPALATPIVSTLVTPLSWRGVAGDLARRNALRNPRRTSATSAALLVGVGVVTLFTVFGASVSASIEAAVERSLGGDLVVRSSGFSGAGLSTTLIDEVRALPEIDDVAALGFGAVRLDGEDREAGYADLAGLGTIADFDVEEGDMASVGPGRFAVSTDTAEEHGWTLGRAVPVTFPDGATEELAVAAIYDDRALGGDVLLPADVWSAHAPQTSYVMALLGLTDGTGVDAGRRAVAAIVERHGSLQVHDRGEFVESQAAEIDALLSVIYGLLAVAIVIALMASATPCRSPSTSGRGSWDCCEPWARRGRSSGQWSGGSR